eukprot:COSAG05_NODE_12195_length_478_cov_2.223570_1_plen_83_part_10
MVDVDTEDGMEYAVTVMGPSESGDIQEMRVRFADGVVRANLDPAAVRGGLRLTLSLARTCPRARSPGGRLANQRLSQELVGKR